MVSDQIIVILVDLGTWDLKENYYYKFAFNIPNPEAFRLTLAIIVTPFTLRTSGSVGRERTSAIARHTASRNTARNI
jgi:hypothetical protein